MMLKPGFSHFAKVVPDTAYMPVARIAEALLYEPEVLGVESDTRFCCAANADCTPSRCCKRLDILTHIGVRADILAKYRVFACGESKQGHGSGSDDFCMFEVPKRN